MGTYTLDMIDIAYYTKALEDEQRKLEGELTALGRHDPKDAENWDLKAPEMDIMQADDNEVADRAEELHIDSIVLDELEIRYKGVMHALRKIGTGTYGICEVGGEPIEEERLKANPAARTCKAHLGQEDPTTLD
jgi:DnaK suppressor protein